MRGARSAAGRWRFLEEESFPVCGTCGKTLDVCFQLTSADLSPWVITNASLVALYCFRCRPRRSWHSPKGTAYLKVVEPRHRVTHTSEQAWAPSRLTVGELRWAFPITSWLDFERENVTGAVAELMINTEAHVQHEDRPFCAMVVSTLGVVRVSPTTSTFTLESGGQPSAASVPREDQRR